MFNLICRIERWKYNEEYDVFVSSEGRLRNKKKKEILPKISHNYLFYYSVADGVSKRIPVHRLVMMTFKPLEDYEEMTVDHLNHNTRDNSLSNLEWVKREENQRRSKRDHDIEAEKDYHRKGYLDYCDEKKELFIINGVVFDRENAIEMISGGSTDAKNNREKIEKKLNSIQHCRQKSTSKTYGFTIEPYEEGSALALKFKINGFIFDFAEGVDFIYRHNGFSGTKEKLERNLSNFLHNSKKDDTIMYNFHIEKYQKG